MNHLRANVWLLVLSVAICCGLYPGALWVIGQKLFQEKANGSLIVDEKDGKTVIGSHLIAQPFSGDQYFQPRPSNASYNAAASGASNWGANNYLLRERVARQLGPIVKYRKGPPVGTDVEKWFQKDKFQGKPGIVAQWADMHSSVAQNWIKADKLNADYVTAWQKDHAKEVEDWKKENPDNADPKPEDLAVPFFKSFSAEHPGRFLSAVEHDTPDGKKEKKIELVKDGSDIQGIFFDLWLQEHPKAELEPVPADMVMASGSGLDPHITLKNALYQLDRVAGKWAEDAKPKRGAAQVRNEIEALLHQSGAPLGGLVGVELVNVLEVNLDLRKRYGSDDDATGSAASGEKEKTSADPGKPSQAAETNAKAKASPSKSDEGAGKGKSPAEPSQPKIVSADGPPSDEKKPTPTEPRKSSKATGATETQADTTPPATEPGKRSSPRVAEEKTNKSPQKVEPSVEPSKASKTASAEDAPPRDEKKPAPAEPEKSSKVAATTNGKQTTASKTAPAAEPAKGAPAKATAKTAPAESGAAKVADEENIATIIVQVPTDAKVFFDGVPTQQTGSERTFVTPSLERGKEFQYEIKTEVTRNGTVTSKTQRITVRAGQTTRVQPVLVGDGK